jgi:hypothetical protein
MKKNLRSKGLCQGPCKDFLVTLQNVYAVRTKQILMKRILTKHILTQCILTLNVYFTKTYTNIPGFSLSASSNFSSLPQAPAFGLG